MYHIRYERRFVELYQQVDMKLAENKKYFETYNTLDESYKIMQKEVTLINSITDNFDEAMRSKSSKDQFLTQFKGIIQGVEESLVRQRSIFDAKTLRLDTLVSTHQSLVDEQRRYFKAVKDFQEECNKNEIYTMKLEA